MIKNLLNLTKVALLAFSISLLLGSCTKEYITKEYTVNPEGDFAIVLNKFVTIRKGDWIWNNSTNRYEAIVSYPELSKEEFDNGALVSGVFITQSAGGSESLETLPYVRTWSVDGIKFTETISCTLMYPKSILFSIQASDLEQDPDAPQEYQFKVAIIKNFTY